MSDIEFYKRQEQGDSGKDQIVTQSKAVPYQWLLVNKANTGLQVKSNIPAFRVVGLFNSQDAARKHASRLGDIDTYMYGTNVFFPINTDRCTSPEGEQAIVTKVSEHHKKTLAENKKLFEKNRTQRLMGDASCKAGKGKKDIVKYDDQHQSIPNDIEVSQECRGQLFFVWSYMEDEQLEQPVIRIHATLEDEASARSEASYLSATVADTNLVVSPMYKWIHISREILDDPSIPSKYRNRRLDEIMKRQASHKSQVSNYLSECKTKDVEPSFINLFENNVDPALNAV